jgi:tetratricopeptide (TPR) repeat protein
MTPADCYAHAARAKFDEDDFAAAIELAREGLLEDEYHPGLLQVYGLAAYHLGEVLDALEGLEWASLVAPLDPLAQITLADAYVHLGKPKSARAMLKFLAEPGRCPTPMLPDLSRLLGKVGAYQAERAARERTLQSLRSFTNDVVERKFAQGQGHTLSDDDRAFLRSVQQQWEAFAAVGGDDAESRSVRAEGLHRVGLMRQSLGELQKAEENYLAALALRKQLAADFPNRTEFRQNLAHSHNNLGTLMYATGRLTEAEQSYTAALVLIKQLVAEFPNRPEFRQLLAWNCSNLGNLLRDTGRLKEAEAVSTESLALLKELAADHSSSPVLRQELAKSCDNLGHLLRNIGRQKEAEQSYNKALVLRKQLVADFPTRPEFRDELAGSHINLGILLHATGRLTEAEQNYNSALALYKPLVADFLTQPQFRHHLSVSYLNLGNLLRDTGRQKEAEQNYSAALTLYKQLAADFPTVSDYQIELSASCCNFGHLLRDTGKLQESLTWFSDAITRLHPVLERQPKHPTARQFLRKSYGARAMSYDRLGQFAQAVADWDRVVELSPENEQRFNRQNRAKARVRAGQVAEAVAEVAELTKLSGWNAVQQYSFAGICAVAASKDADKKTEYADRAMELLRQAVKAGYKDAARMKQDTDLDPLRGRDDFKMLLVELEKKSPSPKEVASPPSEKK